MSVLQKGGLMVVAGTVLASVLILWVGKDEAGKIKSVTTQGITSKTVSVEESVVLKDNNSKIVMGTDKISTRKAIGILPPPGPFIEGTNNLSIVHNVDSLIAPTAPNAPVQKVVENTPSTLAIKSSQKTLAENMPKKPMVVVAPSREKVMVKAPAQVRKILLRSVEAPKISSNDVVSQGKPQFGKVTASSPVAPMQETSAVPATFTSKASFQKPIWMEEAPIQPAMKKSQPKKPQRFVKQNIQNQQENFPTQRYMIVPTPMYAPNYNYLQAPMYGSGYYYPPASQYMMPTMGETLGNQQARPKALPPKGNNIK